MIKLLQHFARAGHLLTAATLVTLPAAGYAQAALPGQLPAPAAGPAMYVPAPVPAVPGGATTTAAPAAAVPVPTTPVALAATIAAAEKSQNGDTLLIAYGQAATDPVLARVVLGQLLSQYYALRNQAQTAEQASQAVNEASLRFLVFQAAQNSVIVQQNQQLLQQNQRLIALMEEMVRQWTPPPPHH